ncbi:hypothetical protein [Microscilla marina]|uniref:Uncharacterized protein n=1 Tax=Microscilla marina ATCC 23134 TaxID=313606 RepID=A1ZM93_MICM2|nr:hypothetical protein [Microscilla marina]EAY28625.1 hypothetical protein M23134_04472 [Microscilla marina ATCC 23134]
MSKTSEKTSHSTSPQKTTTTNTLASTPGAKLSSPNVSSADRIIQNYNQGIAKQSGFAAPNLPEAHYILQKYNEGRSQQMLKAPGAVQKYGGVFRWNSQEATQYNDYEIYIYKGQKEEGTLYRVFLRHKQAGNISISFKEFLSMNTHIKNINNIDEGAKIHFPKGTKLISPKQVFQSKAFKKLFQAPAFKQAYVQYLADVKRDIQLSTIYVTNGLGKNQKAEVDGLGLNEEEKIWFSEGSDKAVSITHLRYILIPDDTREGIARKVGLPSGLLDLSNKWKTSGEHGGKNVLSAHPGDSVKVPLSTAKLEHFDFAKWRQPNKHGGALLSDMQLAPDYIHYFAGKDKQRHAVKMPVVWIHGYSLKGNDWTNKAHEFIYKNYDALKSTAKGNTLEIGIGNNSTKAISVYKYQHQKPSANTAITAHFDSLENYAKHKKEIQDYKNVLSDQARVQQQKTNAKNLGNVEAANIGTFLGGLGALLEGELPYDGSKTKLFVGVYAPVTAGIFLGMDLKIEAQRSGPKPKPGKPAKSGSNIKLTSKLGVTIKGNFAEIAEVGLTLGGYVEAQGVTGNDVMTYYQLAVYKRLRKMASKYMVSDSLWVKILNASLAITPAWPVVALQKLLDDYELNPIDALGVAMHGGINFAWGNNANDFKGAESWANKVATSIKANTDLARKQEPYAESGMFVKVFFGVDAKDAKTKVGMELEVMHGSRLDKASIEKDEKKGDKNTKQDYSRIGQSVTTLAYKVPISIHAVSFEIGVKCLFEGSKARDADITIVFGLDVFKIDKLSGLIPGVITSIIANVSNVLKNNNKTPLNWSQEQLKLAMQTSLADPVLREKMKNPVTSKGLGASHTYQLAIKLTPIKWGKQVRAVEIMLYDAIKITADVGVVKGEYESANPLIKKIKTNW